MSLLIPIKYDLQDKMESYYNDKVSTKKRERDANLEFVEDTVNDILEYINNVDDRFDAEPIMYGSFCHKLTLKHADEFRYGVRLLVPESAQWQTPQSRYALRTYTFDRPTGGNLDNEGQPVACGGAMMNIPKDLKVVPSSVPLPAPPYGFGSLQIGNTKKNWKDLVVNGDVIPFLAKKRLQELLIKARKALDLEGVVIISKKVTGSYLRFTLIRGSRALRVDLAVMVERNIPFHPWIQWPRTQWPAGDKAEKVKQKGMNLRATGQFCWRESFSEARTELIKNIDKDGGVRRKVFCIIKTINNDNWVYDTDADKPVLLSYDLKHMWLWQIEKKPSSQSWKSDQLALRVLELASMLKMACETRALPNYFDQRRNLFAKRDATVLSRTADKILQFMQKPSEYI